jgi:hypothetical protein
MEKYLKQKVFTRIYPREIKRAAIATLWKSRSDYTFDEPLLIDPTTQFPT